MPPSTTTTTGAPPPGVWAPSLVFFHADESIDWAATRAHLTRLGRAGLTGLLLHGSNGEAMHLSRAERRELIAAARAALDTAGCAHVRLMAGTAAEGLRETAALGREAADAGAEWALVLPPAYWTAAMGRERVVEWYLDVERLSPIPVLIYNFPAVRAGIDIDSDTMLALARARPGRIVGAKISDGNVGKLNRLGAECNGAGGGAPPFRAYAGKSDILANAVLGGAAGLIGALVNHAPRTHVRLWELIGRGEVMGREARALQALLARADWEVGKLGGVAGIKAAVARAWGYGVVSTEDGEEVAVVRKPLKSLPLTTLDRKELKIVLGQLECAERRLEEGKDLEELVKDELLVPWAPWE